MGISKFCTELILPVFKHLTAFAQEYVCSALGLPTVSSNQCDSPLNLLRNKYEKSLLSKLISLTFICAHSDEDLCTVTHEHAPQAQHSLHCLATEPGMFKASYPPTVHVP